MTHNVKLDARIGDQWCRMEVSDSMTGEALVRADGDMLEVLVPLSRLFRETAVDAVRLTVALAKPPPPDPHAEPCGCEESVSLGIRLRQVMGELAALRAFAPVDAAAVSDDPPRAIADAIGVAVEAVMRDEREGILALRAECAAAANETFPDFVRRLHREAQQGRAQHGKDEWVKIGRCPPLTPLQEAGTVEREFQIPVGWVEAHEATPYAPRTDDLLAALNEIHRVLSFDLPSAKRARELAAEALGLRG